MIGKLVVLCLVLVLCFVPVSFGAVAVGAEYPYGATDVQLTAEVTLPHPAATAAYSAYFFTFMSSFDGGTLTAVNVWCVV